jgi:glycosyltransferase involved in cell wall biosynthesis
MSASPIVSVVMAVFNSKRFVAQAVESILNQSFRDFEFILVDDGSFDGSEFILEDYAQRDNRIKMFHTPHRGLVDALNTGCFAASGRFIARLDSDDIAKHWRLGDQTAHLVRFQDIALLGGHTECIDESGNTLFTMHWPTARDGLLDYMLLDCHVAHTTVMFRKAVFESVGGYRSTFRDAEDYDFFLRIGDDHRIDNLSRLLCAYRLHAAQVSSNSYEQQILSGIAARLATRARRAKCPEHVWEHKHPSAGELVSLGVRPERIASLLDSYKRADLNRELGWRWSQSRFYRPALLRQQPVDSET